jgi:outer membrane protein
MVRKAPFLKCVRAAGVTLVGTMMVMVSAPAKADTLNQALVKLYNSSPDLMAARYAAEATNEVFNQVAANALPQVTSTWQTAYGRTYNEILRDTGDFTTSGSLSGGLSVSQTISPVISGGVVQTRKSVEAGWAGYDQNEQSIILSGIQAYLGVIQAQSAISLQASNITLLERQLEAAQSRFDAGSGTRTDIAQVSASLADAQAGVQQARGNLAIAQASYQQIFGSAPQSLIFPSLPTSMPATLQEAMAVAIEDNPSVKSGLVALEEAAAKMKVTQAELQPSYQLGLSAQRNQDILAGGGTTNFSTSVGVSVPLYGNRQISKSKIRQDEIAIYRLEEQLRSIKSGVELQVVQAWNQYMTAQAVGQARASQIYAAELSLRGAEAELDAGTKTNLDVISAQQSLTGAQVAASTARVDVVQGAYNLVAAMGKLAASDLRLPVQYYEPQREFENRKIRNLATLLYDR